MIAVAAGEITLSDRRTTRSWSVELNAFEVAVHPVTQGEYAEITGEWPGTTRGTRLPVDGVSWRDAILFCNTLSERAGLGAAYRVTGNDVVWDTTADGYRLPAEAEWERACRAGTTGPRYGPLDAIAWYRGNSDGRSRDVGGSSRTPGACTTPWAMCGSGAGICTTPRCTAPTGYCAAVGGSTSTGVAVPPCVGAVTRPIASTTSDSVWLGVHSLRNKC
jgi:formylglycine-generating enzyme required for sulfatase activity